jgi:nucleoside 2-deoxyribosyltransferase
MKKKIYIAGPYTLGDVAANVREAIETGDQLIRAGFVPFIPHLSHLWHLVAPKSYEDWLAYDFEWVLSCDGLLRIGQTSRGADREVSFAKKNDIPVFASMATLINHFAE